MGAAGGGTPLPANAGAIRNYVSEMTMEGEEGSRQSDLRPPDAARDKATATTTLCYCCGFKHTIVFLHKPLCLLSRRPKP